jgi:hypothetical protein
MLAEITTALTSVIGWVGDVVEALVGENGALAPLLPIFAVGIAVSALMLGIRAIRGFAWGN